MGSSNILRLFIWNQLKLKKMLYIKFNLSNASIVPIMTDYACLVHTPRMKDHQLCLIVSLSFPSSEGLIHRAAAVKFDYSIPS